MRVTRLFFIGLVQPLGCIWPLADAHAQLVTQTILGHYTPPADMRARIQRYLAHMRRDFLPSARHTLEVEYHKHLWAVQREMPLQRIERINKKD